MDLADRQPRFAVEIHAVKASPFGPEDGLIFPPGCEIRGRRPTQLATGLDEQIEVPLHALVPGIGVQVVVVAQVTNPNPGGLLPFGRVADRTSGLRLFIPAPKRSMELILANRLCA